MRFLPKTFGYGAVVVVTVALLGACSSPGGRRGAPVLVRDAGGFSITERVRVGVGVRGDFEDAVELLEQEEYERGIQALEAILERSPDLTAAHIDLAIAHRKMGNLEKAEASIKRALELSPKHPAAHNELGIVYRKSGRFAEARASYEKALDLYPDFHFARRNLAILCDVFLGDLECALENYELYSRIVPDDEDAAMWVSDLRNRLGRTE